MWISFRNKLGIVLGSAVFLISAAGTSFAGRTTSITADFVNSSKIFTAGASTNTPNTVFVINLFSGGAAPDAGELIQIELYDGSTKIEHGVHPSSFTTTTGSISYIFPITFFRASSNCLLKIIAQDPAVTDETSSFQVNAGSAAKLVVVGPGMELAEGTNPSLTDGTSGSFIPQEANQAFPVRVYITDNQFNLITSRTDTVRFASGDLITLPADGALTAGEASFNVTITGARVNGTITVSDVTDGGIQSGTLAVTTAGPPSLEVFPFPSPFNPTQEDIIFRFRLESPDTVTLMVKDAFGQPVWEKSVSAANGFTNVTWNGRNDKGHIVAAGVYYILLEKGGSIESKKKFGVIK